MLISRGSSGLPTHQNPIFPGVEGSFGVLVCTFVGDSEKAPRDRAGGASAHTMLSRRTRPSPESQTMSHREHSSIMGLSNGYWETIASAQLSGATPRTTRSTTVLSLLSMAPRDKISESSAYRLVLPEEDA